ncbi:MAG: MliC family protein [Burkholderiales bacterium]|nr:MliC family protein [Burkholderiales bacterium]
MKRRITRMTTVAGATLLLAACSSMNLDVLSFGGIKEQNTSRPPAGATAYQCDANKRLFVRYLDNGAATWVILPGREFRLNKTTSAAGTRYSNGSDTLELKDGGATLSDGATVTHADCKASSS